MLYVQVICPRNWIQIHRWNPGNCKRWTHCWPRRWKTPHEKPGNVSSVSAPFKSKTGLSVNLRLSVHIFLEFGYVWKKYHQRISRPADIQQWRSRNGVVRQRFQMIGSIMQIKGVLSWRKKKVHVWLHAQRWEYLANTPSSKLSCESLQPASCSSHTVCHHEGDPP